MPHVERFASFTLESGEVLSQVPVAYRTWGRLNARGDNAILVCHALTGDTDVEAWWPGLLGPGRALDTDRYFVVCANVIGSPYGTVSPVTIDPETGQPYGGRFPIPTVRDTVALHRALLDRIGVRQLALVIGGSLGGMQTLEWAMEGDFVRAIAPVSVGGRHSAWCIAWSEAQRQAIYRDPRWKEGHYVPDDAPRDGLAIARVIAMISYRSFGSFQGRFGRQAADGSTPHTFEMESYLHHQGDKLVGRFDAACYVRLTQKMDTHDISRGRGEYLDVLRRIEQPSLVIGVDTDLLYPLAEQRELAEAMPRGRLAVITAPDGHDGFLIEHETVNTLVLEWFAQLEGSP
ncbi:MAG: homoserine O-acetyltransferase [Acidobacteria bacterium]|nr:homoserine O-acetyltransferase [Acidobacteriota bacterium]